MRGPQTGSEDRPASPARPGWKRPIVLAGLVAGSCLAVVVLAVAAAYLIADLRADARYEAALERARAAGLPLTVEEMVPPEIPDSENAAPLYEEAVDLIAAINEDAGSSVVGEGAYECLDAKGQETRKVLEEHPDLAAYLAKYDDAVRKLEEASLRPGLRFNYSQERLEGMMPNLPGRMMEGALIVAVLARLAAANGSCDEAVAHIETLARMEKHLAGGPSVPELLVRKKLRGYLLPAVGGVLQSRLTEEQLARLASALAGPSDDGHLKRELGWEAVYLEQAFAKLISGGFSREHEVLQERIEDVRLSFYVPGLLRSARAYQVEQMTQLWTKRHMPVTAVLPAPSEPEAHKSLSRLIKGAVLVGMGEPILPWAVGCAARDLVKLGVACRRYELKTGAFPDGLEDIIAAGFLKEIPPDPCGGEAYHYVRTETGVIIYSNGGNLVDDGGEESESPAQEGDFVLELTSITRP